MIGARKTIHLLLNIFTIGTWLNQEIYWIVKNIQYVTTPTPKGRGLLRIGYRQTVAPV